MPICRTCGHDLPASFFHADSDQCPACRGAYAGTTAATMPARPVTRPKYPPVTTTLMAISIAVYLVQVIAGVSPVDPDPSQLLKWGANYGPLSLGAQPWRILTSNYLHGGIIHLALNMWCLWNLGALAERIFERWTYILIYTFCGLTGSLASVGLHPMRFGAGASGAIFGLAGALISALYLGHLPVPPRALKSILRSLLSFAGNNLFFGAVVKVIDNSAHSGGLICGLILGAVLARHLTSLADEGNSWRRGVFIVAALIFGLGFYLVRRAVVHALTGQYGS